MLLIPNLVHAGCFVMYNVINVSDRLRVPPEFFGMDLETAIVQILRDKYERRMDADSGIVLAIWNAKSLGDGNVIPGDGAAHMDVVFDALVFKPVINEIIDSDVSEIVEFGAFVALGPVEGLIHLSQIANDFLSYNKRTGMLSGKESKKVLRKGDLICAKISTVSMKNNVSDTKIGLTMRPDGLGKGEWVEMREKRKAQPEKAEREEKPEAKKKAHKDDKKKE